jgi:hypothetical protein
MVTKPLGLAATSADRAPRVAVSAARMYDMHDASM